MHITMSQIKEARKILAALKPKKVTLDDNRSMTVKEAIFALAPTLERMKKRGFDTQELAEKLHEKGIDVKPPTLAKYLNEFRRGKDRKKDTPRRRPCSRKTPHPRRNRTDPPGSARESSPSGRIRRWTNCSADHHPSCRHILKRPLEIPGPRSSGVLSAYPHNFSHLDFYAKSLHV